MARADSANKAWSTGLDQSNMFLACRQISYGVFEYMSWPSSGSRSVGMLPIMMHCAIARLDTKSAVAAGSLASGGTGSEIMWS